MRTLILASCFITLISCNFNEIKKNKEEDKNEAEKVTKLFFSEVKENNKENIYKLFSNKFFEVTNKQELDKIIETANTETGSIKNYTLLGWETTILKGTNPKADYLLTYYVKRRNLNTLETFSMQKENNEIKIIGYNIKIDNR